MEENSDNAKFFDKLLKNYILADSLWSPKLWADLLSFEKERSADIWIHCSTQPTPS